MPSPLLNSLTSLSQLGQVIHDKSEKGKAFQTLAVDRIYSKAQPRTVFENLEELAESLKELGQQQPIVVSPDNKGYYVIEQGERRWRAAKLAGLITLDCMVMNREKDGETDRMLRQLTENIQRDEMTLWDLSHAIAALVCQDMTVRQIAKKLGKVQSYISTLNAIAELPKELEVLVKERHLQDAQSVRKLQKLYQEDPRVVSDQIEEWSKNDDFTISRAQVADFIQSLGNSEENLSRRMTMMHLGVAKILIQKRWLLSRRNLWMALFRRVVEPYRRPNSKSRSNGTAMRDG